HPATVIIDVAALTDSERSLVFESLRLSGPIRTSEPLIIRLSTHQASALVDRLRETSAAATLGKVRYVGFTTELLPVIEPGTTNCIASSPPPEISDALRASLGVLKGKSNRKYYVIDFFAGPHSAACEHGQKV